MKKSFLLAALCALFLVPSVNAQEVTYVEDPAQGHLFNSFKNNWFIMLEAGPGVMMTPNDKALSFGKRIGFDGQLTFGKWFSPIMGARIGVNAYNGKGAVLSTAEGGEIGLRKDIVYGAPMTKYDQIPLDGQTLYGQRYWQVGPVADFMLSLTNWWCGYHPGRVYNAVLYAGVGAFFALHRHNEGAGEWGNSRWTNFGFRVGLLNTFRLNNHWDFLLDIKTTTIDEHFDGFQTQICNMHVGVLAGFSYKFNKTEWQAPITAVCPTWKYTDAEGDALAARLQAAEAKIADLEKQLRDCLNRKPEVVKEVEKAPLAIVYYPIGKSTITGHNVKVVNAVAEVMKANDTNYTLTGWADNYTGNDKINTKLRKNRVNGVKNALVKKGIAEGRLDAQINDGNRTNFGAKCASLDRAVTIEEAK